MPQYLPLLLTALIAAGLLSLPAAAESDAPQETSPPPARSESAGEDSLRYRVKGGEVLIIALPSTIDGSPAPRYSIIRAPALSWLQDRSFFWRTLPADVGEHVILFSVGPEGTSQDTLTVSVSVW
jgi:hypothetical protein